VGGFALSRLQQMLASKNAGSFTVSFYVAGSLLILGALLTFAIKSPAKPSQA
jgi:hypothetical protein